MRDDDRTQRPERTKARDASGTARPRPAASRPVARPSTIKKDGAETRAPQGARKPASAKPRPRRDLDYLYPDEAYYRKSEGAKVSSSGSKKKKKKKKKRGSAMGTLLYSVFAVLAALLLAFVLKTAIVDVVRVSGDAMAHTLQEGDWVLVTKFDYWSGSPKQGDVVSVELDKIEGTIIRRVIAGPEQQIRGDDELATVEITAMGETLVNGETISEPYVSRMSYDAYPKTDLARGRCFVLSDNRQVTLDSRSADVGVVRKSQLNHARFVIWPPENWKSLDD